LHCGIPRLRPDKKSESQKRFFFAAFVFPSSMRTRWDIQLKFGGMLKAGTNQVGLREEIWVMMKLNSVAFIPRPSFPNWL
jgi:hypothetical protein